MARRADLHGPGAPVVDSGRLSCLQAAQRPAEVALHRLSARRLRIHHGGGRETDGRERSALRHRAWGRESQRAESPTSIEACAFQSSCLALGAIPVYSQRGATAGSIRVARRAGTYVASMATTNSKRATEPKVSGSTGLTPNKRLVMAGDNTAAAAAPSVMPTPAIIMPPLRIIQTT